MVAQASKESFVDMVGGYESRMDMVCRVSTIVR